MAESHSSTSRRWPFERRIVALACALALPALLLGSWQVWRLPLDAVTRGVLLFVLVVALATLVLTLLKTVMDPLRRLANVVEGYRAGDYTFRSRSGLKGDALADLSNEIGLLGRKLHSDRLQALEVTALLDKLVSAIDVAILAFDGEKKLRVLNPAAARLLGMPLETALARSAAELRLETYLEGPAGARTITTLPNRTGRWQVTHGTFREGGVAQHLLVVSDLRQALREEERATWQRLIRVIGHEVNNSLAPIKSLAHTLHDLLGPLLSEGSTRDDALNALQLIADRSTSLREFLAQYSRLARLPPPIPAWTSLQALVARVAALQHPSSIDIQVPAGLEVNADAGQLEQALINLTRNALEAGPSQGVHITIAAYQRDDDLVITVVDDGPGIANPQNLFVPFFTTKPNGSGIGLILSRQIAEAHGGSLTLENRETARGAVATLELPRAARQLPQSSMGN